MPCTAMPALIFCSQLIKARPSSLRKALFHAGLARARAQGKRLGRPSIPVTIERKIRDALKKGGTGIRKLAAKHHVGVGTVQRIKRQLDR